MMLTTQKAQFADVLPKLLEAKSFYTCVPKDFEANLRWRQELLNWVGDNRTRQQCMMTLCSEDILFWWNSFVFTYDPRRIEEGHSPVLPFITYDYQDEAILEMNAAIGRQDMLTEKSRDMGASYMICGVFDWRLLFRFMESFMMVSRKEDLVDGNSDSLFWKIDQINKYCPGWMTGGIKRLKLHIENEWTQTTIDGESTTGNVGRGGRRTAIALDEFAAVDRADGYRALEATQANTMCRLFNSTPIGTANAYHDMSVSPHVKKIQLHWSQHPRYNPGLYQVDEGGRVKALDEIWHLQHPGYEFVQTPGGWHGLRSPWYDNECRRTPIPTLIKQELDMDHRGSGACFFDAKVIANHCEQYAMEPTVTGELDYDSQRAVPREFIPGVRGRIKLWCELGRNGKPVVEGGITIGADVAVGTGASNSTISAVCDMTGEKILEYADPNTRPDEHARLAVAIARWLSPPDIQALLIWEANGAGRTFGQTVDDLAYPNVWFRRAEDRLSKKSTDFAGWYSDTHTKRELLSRYQIALSRGDFINHSRKAVENCLEYVFDGQRVEHSSALKSMDDSGARDNHGDIVIADALCNWPLAEGITGAASDDLDAIDMVPANSIAGRRAEKQRRERQDDSWINA